MNGNNLLLILLVSINFYLLILTFSFRNAFFEFLSSFKKPRQQVKVALYYETGCPFVRKAFLLNLYPAYRKLGDEVDFQMIPFGKANFIDNQIVCQHGSDECYGNAYQACCLHIYGLSKLMLLADCVFRSDDWREPEIPSKQCALRLGLDDEILRGCATDELGLELLRQYKRKTEELRPPLKYVPDIRINNETFDPLQDIYEYVCHVYGSEIYACG